MAERKLSITIVGNASKAKKELAGLDGALGKTEKQAKRSGDGIKSSLVSVGLGAAAFGAVKAFDDAQKVMAQSEAVIKSTGGAANVTAEQMSNLAGELSKKTGIDDEAIQSGENLIATFTGIRNEAGKGNDVFDQTTAAALDMSVALGTDMTSSAQMLGKALNDPIAGLSKLTRAGVVFTDAQKQQITALQESGDKLGAQKVILEEINKEFGGSAEAQATSLGKAKVSVDNLAESLGGVLMPVVKTAADGLGALADGLGELPRSVQTVTVFAGAGAIAWAKWGDSIGPAISKGKKMVDAMGGIKGSFMTLGPIVAGAAVAFTLWQDQQEKEAASAAKWKASLTSMREEIISTGDTASEVFTSTYMSEWFLDNAGAAKDAGLSISDLSAAVSGSDKEWKAYRRELEETEGYSYSTSAGLDDLRSKFGELGLTTKQQTAINKELGIETDEVAGATDNATRAANDSRSAAERQAAGLKAVADAADAARQEIKDFYDATTAGLNANIGAEAALDALTASVVENGHSLDINEEKGRANVSTFTAFKDAAVESALAVQEQGGTAWDAAGKLQTYADRLKASAREAGYSEDQIGLMIGTMKLTPKDIRTRFLENTPEAKRRTQDLIGQMNRTPSSKHTTFNTSVSGLSAVNVALDHAARTRQARINVTMGVIQNNTGMSTGQIFGNARASGGPVAAGTPYLVGEEGPELVTFGQDGMVHDASATRSMMTGPTGGGFGGAGSVAGMASSTMNVYVTVQGQVVTAERLVDVIVKGVNEKQGRSARPIMAGVSG